MKILIPIIIIIILYFIIQLIYKKQLISKYINNLTNILKENNSSVTTNIVKNYENVYEVKTENKTFFIQFVIVPLNSRIQINNNITWELKTGGKEGIGEAPNKKTMINEIVKFMSDTFNGRKIVVLLPRVSKIVKYINECEIVLVNETTNVYGAKVISGDNYNIFK